MSRRVERVVATLYFPVLIVGSMAGAIALITRGVSPELVTGLVIALAYLFLATLERWVPLHPEWSRSHGDVRADLSLGGTNAIVNFGTEPLIAAAATWLAAGASLHAGATLWPTHWPLALQLFPALLLGELVEYSVHRAMHEVPWLWRIHAPHHSATRLYWLNAVRFHPIDVLLIGPGKLIPLIALGAGPGVMALVLIFAAVHGSCQHANLPCRIGPLNWIFSMAELHRWHHSPILAEANHNYGGNLIFWDIVFGTRWLPKDREPPVRTGIEGMDRFPRSYWGLLAAPFRWAAILRGEQSR